MREGTTVGEARPHRFLSLSETQRVVEDDHYDSTVENFEAMTDFNEFDEVWEVEAVSVRLIDEGQLIDDPDDHSGHEKAESLRESMRDGRFIPPIFLLHMPEERWPYLLLEGRHRYNAHYREGVDVILAWVAHYECSCEPGNAPPQTGSATQENADD
jgi:hypothetical protein